MDLAGDVAVETSERFLLGFALGDANIEITDDAAKTSCVLDAADLVLARHLPEGDGTLTYLCSTCGQVVCVPLSFDDVMAAVFAGATPVDVEI